jgi:hypothetical protein
LRHDRRRFSKHLEGKLKVVFGAAPATLRMIAGRPAASNRGGVGGGERRVMDTYTHVALRAPDYRWFGGRRLRSHSLGQCLPASRASRSTVGLKRSAVRISWYVGAAVFAAFTGGAAVALDPDLSPGDAFRSGYEAYKAGDTQTALEALNFAAGKGHPGALWKLGRMYATGDLVTEDDAEAMRLFAKVANEYADGNPQGPDAPFVADAFVTLGGYYQRAYPARSTRIPVERAATRIRGLLLRRRRRAVFPGQHDPRWTWRPTERPPGRALVQAICAQGPPWRAGPNSAACFTRELAWSGDPSKA